MTYTKVQVDLEWRMKLTHGRNRLTEPWEKHRSEKGVNRTEVEIHGIERNWGFWGSEEQFVIVEKAGDLE